MGFTTKLLPNRSVDLEGHVFELEILKIDGDQGIEEKQDTKPNIALVLKDREGNSLPEILFFDESFDSSPSTATRVDNLVELLGVQGATGKPFLTLQGSGIQVSRGSHVSVQQKGTPREWKAGRVSTCTNHNSKGLVVNVHYSDGEKEKKITENRVRIIGHRSKLLHDHGDKQRKNKKKHKEKKKTKIKLQSELISNDEKPFENKATDLEAKEEVNQRMERKETQLQAPPKPKPSILPPPADLPNLRNSQLMSPSQGNLAANHVASMFQTQDKHTHARVVSVPEPSHGDEEYRKVYYATWLELDEKALKIQNTFRKYLARQIVKWIKEKEELRVRREVEKAIAIERNNAAIAIQRVFRGHLGKRYYAYYEELAAAQMFNPAMDISAVSADPLKPSRVSGLPPGGYPPLLTNTVVREQFRLKVPLRIYSVTWNLACLPLPKDLRELLRPHQYHVYAIGVQELGAVVNSFMNPDKSKWENLLLATLGADYYMVKSSTLVQMHLVIFCHKAMKPFISDIHRDTVSTGISLPGTKLGNKGGVGICFRMMNKCFLFVNSHLAAHQEKLAARNANFEEINARMKLPDGICHQEPLIDHFDFVIWMGDLNYRVDDYRPDEVIAMLSQGTSGLSPLLSKDQLTMERTKGTTFHGYQEAEIQFPPTYKYQVGTSMYGTKRTPSWTDRVLYKPHPNFRAVAYNAIEALKNSDHYPVYAMFEVQELDPGDTPWPECSNDEFYQPLGNDDGDSRSTVCAVM